MTKNLKFKCSVVAYIGISISIIELGMSVSNKFNNCVGIKSFKIIFKNVSI